MSAFLLRFKANYLEKMRVAKIYFFSRGPNLTQTSLYLVGTVLKTVCVLTSYGNFNYLNLGLRKTITMTFYFMQFRHFQFPLLSHQLRLDNLVSQKECLPLET